MRIINIDLVPNFEEDDYEIMKRYEPEQGSDPSKDDDLERNKLENSFNNVKNILKSYFPQGDFYFFNSARSALTLLLYILKEVSHKKEVITQAFSCLVVPNAIKFAGLKPVFVDIDQSFNLNLEDLKKKINKNTLAIIIQNTFGLPAKIDEILNLAKENNIFIIENLTHSLGAKYKNIYLGNFGDFALLSFNRNKVISSIIGGALVINNNRLLGEKENFLEKMEKEYQKLEEYSKNEIRKILFTGKILYQAKKNYNFLTKVFLYFLRKKGLTLEMVSEVEKFGRKPKNYLMKFPQELFPLLENQLKKLEKFNEHRKKIAFLYLKEFKDFEINENSEPIFLRFPLFSEKRDEILEKFKKEKIYLGDWYTRVLAPFKKGMDLSLFDYQGDCPYAEKVSKKIFNLPTHIDVDEEIANYIVNKIKKLV